VPNTSLYQRNIFKKKPANISFREAAALTTVLNTSIQALKNKAQVQKGEKIFINGGSTACGSIAIQLAKKWGLTVSTTCSQDTRDYVQQFGPDILINYKDQKWSEFLKGSNYDVIFDCIGDAWDQGQCILKTDGSSRVVSITPPEDATQGIGGFAGFAADIAKRKVFNFFGSEPDYMFFLCDRDDMESRKIALNLIEVGEVKIPIDSVHSLENAKEAFARSMSGRAKGKIIIEVKPQDL